MYYFRQTGDFLYPVLSTRTGIYCPIEDQKRVSCLLNKDRPIENDGENVAKAIIQIKNHIIKKIHTFDSLIFDPWISEGGKARAKRNKEFGFVQMIKELAEISTDYTCKDQNKELENQSKKIVLRAREFSQWLKKEPINQVIEAWLREQNQ
jgi:hypothetical protein